jgi:hypothetical protein
MKVDRAGVCHGSAEAHGLLASIRAMKWMFWGARQWVLGLALVKAVPAKW